MEKIGEIETAAKTAVNLGIEVSPVTYYNQEREIVGYSAGIYGPARTRGARTLYCNALWPDSLSWDKEVLYPTPEAAMAAWQESQPRTLAPIFGMRTVVREIINAEGLYRQRP